MKKRVKYLWLAAVVLVLLALVSVPLVNEYCAARIEEQLISLPLPENTEYVDSFYRAGKLTGNGNGMQFLGGMLLKSELSLEKLDEFYAQYRQGNSDILVKEQLSSAVDIVEHETVVFSCQLLPGERYYMVYTWGKGVEPFASVDMRGH